MAQKEKAPANYAAFDIVVFGATSFVGQIICRYLAKHYGFQGQVRWALAGRNMAKLEGVRDALGAEAQSVTLIQADASDQQSLNQLCSQTRVVLSTVGPYAFYGEPLVKACADLGTDYVDLCGEVHWIKEMIDRYSEQAGRSGARLISCCGFDSVPSDLGVYYLQKNAQQRFSKPLSRIKYRVKAVKGGFSGGTVASIINVVQAAAKDRALRKTLANPYALCVGVRDDGVQDGRGRRRTGQRQPSVKRATFDRDFNTWLAPFIMAGINTCVVHRSNLLLAHHYGVDFKYDEAVMTGAGMKGFLRAQAMTGTLAGLLASVAVKPLSRVLEKWFLPGPGQGPSEKAQENGFFDIRLRGETAEGEVLSAKVTGDRDPGYGATAKMITEAAVLLALTPNELAIKGGFWTPASALGDRYIERLQAYAGLIFELQIA